MKNTLGTILLVAAVLALCGGVASWAWGMFNAGTIQANQTQNKAYQNATAG